MVLFGWISGIEVLGHGENKGTQTSGTYDPLGFEVRIRDRFG
jgi:hypothetical protein